VRALEVFICWARLFLASEAYHRNLAKRKDNGVLDDGEKLMPVDALGMVMIIHGEEFGEDSPFGVSSFRSAIYIGMLMWMGR
jgi:hypothetical protein